MGIKSASQIAELTADDFTEFADGNDSEAMIEELARFVDEDNGRVAKETKSASSGPPMERDLEEYVEQLDEQLAAGDEREPEEDEPRTADAQSGAKAELVERAKALDFDEEKISKLEASGLLEEVVDRLEKSAAPATEEDEKGADEQAPNIWAEDGEDEFPDLENDEYPVSDNVKGYLTKLRDRDKASRTQIKQVLGVLYQTQMERAIENLPEGFEEILGRGEMEDFAPTSREYKARQELGKKIGEVIQTYQTAKKSPPRLKAVVKEAAMSLFGDKLVKGERQKIAGAVQQRKSMLLAPPKSPGKRPMSERERIYEANKKALPHIKPK
jgi:hypothetical protein